MLDRSKSNMCKSIALVLAKIAVFGGLFIAWSQLLTQILNHFLVRFSIPLFSLSETVGLYVLAISPITLVLFFIYLIHRQAPANDDSE